jgi:hypothetical protein
MKRLKRLCEEHDTLPSSCLLMDDPVLEDSSPLYQTNLSDVYRGYYGSGARLVALKRLRVHKGNERKVSKAGCF